MHAYGETNYFKIHSEADEKHELMGRELLKNLTSEKYQRLFAIQQQGWDMLNAVCDRIAKLTELHATKIVALEYVA
jgi:pyrroloquinoline quinone (PQQ) biosynthesis protein C